MNVIIRNAQESDLQSILDIVNYSIVHTTANYNYEPQTLDNQQEWFRQKQALNFPVIIAEFNDRVIGFGTYGTFREKIGYRFTVEHSVYVDSSFIGQGIGKLLLQNLITTAREQGIHVMIGGIDASNEDSIAFHRKFGFTECGIIKEAAFKFDRWLDLLFMQLVLR